MAYIDKHRYEVPEWLQLSLFDRAEIIWDVTPEPGYAIYRCPECGEYRYLPTRAPRRRCILTRGCPGRAERVK